MNIERPQSNQPLPDHAEKVFSGVMFDTYQWEQEMYDGSTVTFEKIKRPDTVVIFPVNDNGDILLTKQEQPGKAPFTEAPGGRVDPGEDILVAAKRELLEETGHEAKEFVLWKSFQPVSKIEWAMYVFIAHGATKVTEQSLDAGEKIEITPVGFDELIEQNAGDSPSDKELYHDFLLAKYDAEKKAELKKIFRQ